MTELNSLTGLTRRTQFGLNGAVKGPPMQWSTTIPQASWKVYRLQTAQNWTVQQRQISFLPFKQTMRTFTRNCHLWICRLTRLLCGGKDEQNFHVTKKYLQSDTEGRSFPSSWAHSIFIAVSRPNCTWRWTSTILCGTSRALPSA